MVETSGAAHHPTPMDPCAALRDALPAYALGVLDGADARSVETHVADCTRCRADLVELEDLVGLLGTTATPVAPRPEVRDALMAAIAAEPARAPLTRSEPTPMPLRPATTERTERSGQARRGVAWRRVWQIGVPAAAAIALVTVGILALLLDRTREERDDALEAQRRIASYLVNGGALSPLLPETGAAADVQAGHGSLAVAPNQPRAMLVVHNLAPSEGGRRYVAWAERDGQRVRLGEVPVNDDGSGYLLLYGPEPISTYEFVGIAHYPPGATEGEPFLFATVPPGA